MRNKQLETRRKEKSYTQLKIAKKACISTRYYQAIEAGESAPNVYVALRIARVLKSTVEVLFGSAASTTEKEPDNNQT